MKFQAAASERLVDCFAQPIGLIELDRFEILVADEGECPAPGTVLNGEANLGEGGWFFEFQLTSDGGGVTGALEAGVGSAGSSGARIFKKAGSGDRAAMGTQISVPLPSSLASPALRFWWNASNGSRFRSEVGTFIGLTSSVNILDTLVGSGAPETYTYCLPPWTHGNVVDLSFTPFRAGDFVAETSELVVDDVEVVSDLRCGDSRDVLDPGFDSAPNRWPGVNDLGAPGSSVRILDDPQLARPPGTGVLQLSYETNQAFISAGTRVWVPPSESNRGPQLVFYSNVPSEPKALVRWLLGRSGTLKAELRSGGGWRRNEVCLPPEWVERWFRFGVSVRGDLSMPLEIFDAPQQVLLDDFELTTDEACPVAATQ